MRNLRYDLAGAFLAGVIAMAGLLYGFWHKSGRPYWQEP